MPETTDVLLIQPGGQAAVYQDLASEFTAVDTPLWACLYAAHLRKHGYSCAIHDTNVSGAGREALEKALLNCKPRLAVVTVFGNQPSASTQTMPAATQLVSLLKEIDPDLPVAMAGTHPSALPEMTLAEAPADYVIRGDGIQTLPALAGMGRGKRGAAEVPGLAYRQGDSILLTNPPERVKLLDEEMPNYAWDLLPPIHSYRAHNWHCFQDFEKSNDGLFRDIRTPYVSLYTSLGCPYQCTYCCINALFGQRGIRYWDVNRVLSWVDQLVTQYGVRNIRFADELFVLDQHRVEKFCKGVIDRGYDLNIWAYARVDTVSPPFLETMRKAGIRWLALGIESPNPAVRGSANKRYDRDPREVVAQIQASDIHVIGNYMFGLPDDTMATMEQTLEDALESLCEFVNFYVVVPYPGSQLHTNATRNRTASTNWLSYSQHSYETTPSPGKNLTPAEILAFRDSAFQRYFSDPGYLASVQRKFGSKARSHIERMKEVRLRRRLIDENPSVAVRRPSP